jgi:hypothetical protein
MEDPQKPSPLNYALPVPKRAGIVRRVLLAGLLGFAVFAAIKWTPVARERLEILNLQRQIRNYQPTLPMTVDMTKPSDDLSTQLEGRLGYQTFGSTLYFGAMRVGGEERLFRIYAANLIAGEAGYLGAVGFSRLERGEHKQGWFDLKDGWIAWPDRVRVVAIDTPDERTLVLQIVSDDVGQKLTTIRLVWSETGQFVLEVENAPDR